MTPDITRSTFDPARHYSKVRLQQGRLLLDADWNEQGDIEAHFRRQHLRDLVGLAGAPKDTDAFRVEFLDDGAVRDLALHPGRFYVDGLLCELEPEHLRIAAFEGPQAVRLEALRADGLRLAQDHWVRLDDGSTGRTVRVTGIDGTTLTLGTSENLQTLYGSASVTLHRVVTYATQPHLPLSADGTQDLDALLADSAARFVAYLDVWDRPVSGVEDPSILDEALGGADTTTRLQRVWQLRLVHTTADSCSDLGPAWQPSAVVRGRMRARAEATAASSDPCIIPDEGGYRRLENQLYRVEVHAGGAAGGTATFLWSRDNAARAARVREIDGTTLRVTPPGRDVLAELTTRWIELTDTGRLLRGEPGHLVRVDDVRGDTLQLESSVPAGLFDPDTRVTLIRRWDSDDAQSLTAGSFLDLEGGVQVEFDNGTFTTGDYWLVPARATTGRILWPADSGTARFAPRHGTEHAFAPLAILRDDGSGFAPIDCRTAFPPLTDIDATDVSFDDASCMLGATTVQEALEALCARDGTCCTLTLVPGPAWASALAQLPAGGDVQICFQAGDYPVTAPVVLQGFGDVKVSGYGAGSRLLAPTSETVLRFEDCGSVLVRDIYAEAGALGSSGAEDGLNGALTFRGCGSVQLESVTARCASGAERAATCLTINGAPLQDGDPTAGVVRVRHCDLRVGHLQVGLLVLNSRRTQVEDNVIRVGRKPRSLGLEQLLENRHYRAGVRRLMIAKGRPTDPETLVGGIPDGWVVFDVQTGQQTISLTFETDPRLQSVWQEFQGFRMPRGVQSTQELYGHLQNMANRVLTNRGALRVGESTFTGFQSWYERLERSNPAVASQGIVIAGQEAREVRIVDNTVYGALQGIHLGLDASTSQTAEQLGTVRVRSNTVQLFLSPFARGRHGVFVGHCDSLLAEDNYVRVRRYPATEQLTVDGIRIDGVLGPRCLVERNHVVGAGPGIRARALSGTPEGGLRAIRHNVIEALSNGTPAVGVQGGNFQVTGNATA